MIPETSANAAQDSLRVLQRFSFAANSLNWNCLKWSGSNRVIGLNIADKLVIFQVNINYAIGENTINRKQWNEENLKFYTVTVEPECEFVFEVGKLANYEQSLRQGYMRHPRKPMPEFRHFDFSPSSALKSYSLVGATTDDFRFLIYLQLDSHKWDLIRNLTKDLNAHYVEKEWNSLNDEIDFDTYRQRLAFISTKCFCWHPEPHYDGQSVRFQLYSATKRGDICRWTITLTSDNGSPKCESTIETIVSTDLGEIETLKLHHQNVLLAESADGRIVLFDTRHDHFTDHQVVLWSERDNLPCYNFCFNQVDNDGSTEIVFHKVDAIFRARLSKDFRMKSRTRYTLDRDIEILALYNYESTDKYCVSVYNSPKVMQFTFPSTDGSTQLILEEIKFVDVNPASNMSIYGFDSSTNRCLMAFVSSNNSFCSKSHALKNVEIVFCTRQNAASVCQYLQQYLTVSLKRGTSTTGSDNVLDYLYLFRHFLYLEPNSEPMEQLIQHMLKHFDKLDKLEPDQSSAREDETQKRHLLRMNKIVRFIVRRYWELVFSPEVNILDTSTRLRVDKWLKNLDRTILKQTTEQVVTRLLSSSRTDSPDQAVASLFTAEQLVSLCNIHRQSAINNVPKGVMDQVDRLAHRKDKSTQTTMRSLFGTDYLHQLVKSKSLIGAMNRCPFCEKALATVTASSQCPAHQLDVCANSLLIVDPVQHDVDLCTGCLQSKLLRPRVWPSLSMCPFDYSYDWCLFCL